MPFIVLDFDETYTACPAIFNAMLREAEIQGTEVVVCTARNNRPHDDNRDVFEMCKDKGLEIIFSGSDSKWKALQQAGYLPENAIWIDDTPRAIEGLKW